MLTRNVRIKSEYPIGFNVAVKFVCQKLVTNIHTKKIVIIVSRAVFECRIRIILWEKS